MRKDNKEKRMQKNLEFFLKVVADIEINRPEEEKKAVREHLRKTDINQSTRKSRRSSFSYYRKEEWICQK